MKNRIPTYPGRVKLTPVAGMTNTYTMVRADDPTDEGTPLNKGTLLSDETAEKLRFAADDDPTVNDALAFLAGAGIVFVGDGAPSASIPARIGDHYINTDTTAALRVWICTARAADGTVTWGALAGAKLVMKTEIFTASGYWTAPANLEGDVHVRLFGGGGGGASGTNVGGGGGGHMQEYAGTILPGKQFYVTIGAGGVAGAAGGTTSFGNLASASGGSPGVTFNGGDGGTGGGSGGCTYVDSGNDVAQYSVAGDGAYGGGGGSGVTSKRASNTYAHNGGPGGNGGAYGGGGGACGYQQLGGSARNGMFSASERGGAGYLAGTSNRDGGQGENTTGTGLEFEGAGNAGTGSSAGCGGGGGGLGGNGGDVPTAYGGSGGGGGMGGNGGDGGRGNNASVSSMYNYSSGGGGGGGWGGNGGNGGSASASSQYGSGGGGGGYGKSGNGGAGGSNGGNGTNGGIAAGGGGGATGGKGGSGVVIITYYVREVA